MHDQDQQPDDPSAERLYADAVAGVVQLVEVVRVADAAEVAAPLVDDVEDALVASVGDASAAPDQEDLAAALAGALVPLGERLADRLDRLLAPRAPCTCGRAGRSAESPVPPAQSERAERRRALGLGGVYSVSEAAALLPFSDADGRCWLREQGLVTIGARGKEVVAWAAVVQRLSPPPSGGGPARPHRPVRNVAAGAPKITRRR